MFQIKKLIDLLIILIIGFIFWFYPSPPLLVTILLYSVIALILIMTIIRAYKSVLKEFNEIEQKCYDEVCLKKAVDVGSTSTIEKKICGSECNNSSLSQFSPFPQYKETKWSILDAVPPPDPFHKYTSDGFNREPTDKNDYDRWASEWKPDGDFSIKYLDLSNDFYL